MYHCIAEVCCVDVQTNQVEVSHIVAELKGDKANLELGYIKVPKDGKFLKIYIYPGGKVNDTNEIAGLL